MIRTCFLCNETTELIYSAVWPLPGLETTEIGFSVCPNCGSVSQSPTVSYENMIRFYQSVAVYTNPGREEKPSIAKVRDLDEQVEFIKRGIGELPNSVLQIGSSDGYTLSRFKSAGADRVLGVEPGKASVEIASRLYGIDCINSTAELFTSNENFELIVLTHVLEHLYKPMDILNKCHSLQMENNGYIYVEVPLLCDVDSLCPGFFSFEHINYYTRNNLVKSLLEAGYYPVSLVEHYNSNLSPIIGVLASTEDQSHMRTIQSEYELNKNIVKAYRQREIKYWQNCLDNIKSDLLEDGRIFIWGAGIHTSQLVANTDILSECNITGLVDSSDLKWNIRQGDWICENPAAISWISGDKIIISSYASEDEIYKSLQWLRDLGVLTLRLHNVGDVKAH